MLWKKSVLGSKAGDTGTALYVEWSWKPSLRMERRSKDYKMASVGPEKLESN